MYFSQWDAPTGTMKAGSIKRASSSNDKVWGEVNLTDEDLEYGTFVAVNPDGGVAKITSSAETIHGIVVRDIYGDKAPKDKTANVGHFSHGDCVVAQAVESAEFKRGTKAYIAIAGSDAGKVTHLPAGAVDLGYWVEEVSEGNNCVAITLGYVQQAVGE